jgi:DNA-binding IscR family transcriptional regulator
MSHRGINGGYTLARDPRRISVFDVIKASEGPRRSGIHAELSRKLKFIPGYHVLGKVSQVVEGMLRELTLEDIEEEVSTPLGLSSGDSSVREPQLHHQTTGSH